MNRPIHLLLSIFTMLLVAGSALAGVTRTTTYLGYNPSTGLNDQQYSILYELPDPEKWGRGPFPLAMWTPGSFERYVDSVSTLVLDEMSRRGFVAASVQYDNAHFSKTCADWLAHASSIYDVTRSTSAISVMCSIAAVSCNAGVVSSGISQGAGIAVVAKNYAAAVRAALAFSVSDTQHLGEGTTYFGACIDKAATAIPLDRLTIINGISDSIFGGQTPLMGVAGLSCPPNTFQCWAPSMSGAGWYIVQDSQVTDGVADHCYMIIGGCATLRRQIEPNWYPATYNWSLKPNLDWLATFGTLRQFSSSGQ